MIEVVSDPRIWLLFLVTFVVISGLLVLGKMMGPPDRFNKKKT